MSEPTVVTTLASIAEHVRSVAKDLGHPDYNHVIKPSLGFCSITRRVPHHVLEALYASRNVTINGSLLYLQFSPSYDIPSSVTVDSVPHTVLYSVVYIEYVGCVLSPTTRNSGPSLFV